MTTSENPTTSPKPVTPMANAELQALMDNTPELVVLDVRTPVEYSHLGHIPNATLIPIQELMERVGELDKSKPTAVICEHGVRSTDASYWMSQQGFDTLYNLVQGMAHWQGTRVYGDHPTDTLTADS